MSARNDFPDAPEPSTEPWNAQTTQLSVPDWPPRQRTPNWPDDPRTAGQPPQREPDRPDEPRTGPVAGPGSGSGWSAQAQAQPPRTGSGYARPAEPGTGGWSPQPETGGWSAQPETGGYSAQPETGGWKAQPETGGWSARPETGGWSAQEPPATPGPPGAQGPVTQMLAALSDTETLPRSRQRALARAQARQRRRRLLALGALLVAVGLVGADLISGRPVGGRHSSAGGRPVPAEPSRTPASVAPSVAVPRSGPGTFAYAGGTGPVVGAAGQLRQFKVAVENSSGQDAAAFADVVQQTLADPRGWIGGGDVRFQRVAQSAKAAFTLYLATPATSEKMCSQGGIHTQQIISCRLPGQVIINLDRWVNAIPGYGASLSVYRQFTLNHEVGRELGHGDEGCPAHGVLAPVMQEQTLGLKGCVANAWPYVSGKRYTGPAIP